MMFPRTPLQQGADLAVDRIIQDGTLDQIEGAPEPITQVPPADALRFAGFAGKFLVPDVFQRRPRQRAPAPVAAAAPVMERPGVAPPGEIIRQQLAAAAPAQTFEDIGLPPGFGFEDLTPPELAFIQKGQREGRGNALQLTRELRNIRGQGFTVTEDGLEKEVETDTGTATLLIGDDGRVFLNDRRIGDVDASGQFQEFELSDEERKELEGRLREERRGLKERVSAVTRGEEPPPTEGAAGAAFEAITEEERRELRPVPEGLIEKFLPLELRLRAAGVGNQARRDRIINEVALGVALAAVPIPGLGQISAGAARLAERGGFLGLLGRGAVTGLKPVEATVRTIQKAVTAPVRGATRLFQRTAATGNEAVLTRVTKVMGEALEGKPVSGRDLKFIRRQNPGLADDVVKRIAEIESKPSRMAVPAKPATETEQIALAKNKLKTVMDEFAKVEREVVKPAKKAGRIRQTQSAEEAVAGIETVADIERAKSVRAGRIIPDVDLPKAQLTPVEDSLLIQSIHESPAFQELLPNQRLNTFVAFNKMLSGERIVPSERALLESVFGFKIPVVKTGAQRVFEIARDIVTFPQRLLASMDNSFPLRQALVPTLNEPRQAIRAFAAQNRIVWGAIKKRRVGGLREQSAAIRRELANSEFAAEAGEAGLFLSRPGNPEEQFLSKLIQRIPVVRKILGPALEVSEELAQTYISVLRMGIFDKWARANAKTWGPQQYGQLARLINIATGRGVIPAKPEVIDLLNGVFFAPRLVASRIQMPFTPFFNQPKELRVLASRWIVGTVGTIFSLMKILEVGGVIDKIETDPRSTDFMKMRVGNTRIDPWGGYQQWVTFFARLLTGERKTQVGEIVPTSAADVTGRIVRSKLSPAAAAAVDILTGKTFIGEELSTDGETIQREAFNRFVPLFIQDVTEAMEEDGWMGGVAASPGFFGWGITAYPSRQFVEWTDAAMIATGREFTRDEAINFRGEFEEVMQSWEEFWTTPRGRPREAFRRQNPEVDASLHFWGETSDVKTPEAAAIVQQLLDKFNMPEELLPIQEEEEPFEESGQTQDEVFFSFVEAVPGFFADFVLENRDQFDQAGLPERIRTAQVEFTKLRRLRSRYRTTTKGFASREREQFRAENPDVDAALVLLGDVSTFQSSEARRSAIRQAEQLGIPQEIIPAFQPTGGGRVRGVGGGRAPRPAPTPFQLSPKFQSR